MFASLPKESVPFMTWTWTQIEPYYAELQRRPIDGSNVVAWLRDWWQLRLLVAETENRLEVATTLDTTDTDAEKRYYSFLEDIQPHTETADNALNQKLIDSGLNPPGYEIPLRDARATVSIFREANLPLKTEEEKLKNEYGKIVGAQTVMWEGKELTLPQLYVMLDETDRALRERVYRAGVERTLVDAEALDKLWVDLLTLRMQIARNADLPDYRAYMWREYKRFDYTPDDTIAFHETIEKVVVPAAVRLYERRRQRLGVETLRPWDLNVNAHSLPPLRPFDAKDVKALRDTSGTMFRQVDPILSGFYDTMVRENLLDLDNRLNKAPGGYCTDYLVSQRPFIFMNAVGTHDDVQTMLHEAGHAFHTFSVAQLPVYQQGDPPIEFCEVASMSMELLAAPYLAKDSGGFYADAEAARARVDHLEGMITFWAYMAVVDAFQHWAYTYPQDALNPDNCDQKWSSLWDRFMLGIDMSGLEAHKAHGWQRKLHIYQVPFYYVEYGLAQVGAVQVWANALRDQADAVAHYRSALALGGTVTLPELFTAAGAKFAWDAETLGEAVALIERTTADLERQAAV